MKTGQSAAGLFGVHGLGDFRSDVSKPALSIEADCRFLNRGRAQDHPGKSERPRFGLCMIEHALRDASAAVTPIEVHATKLGLAGAVAFNTERTDDFIAVLDDPESVASGLGKNLEKLPEFAVDDRRDVALEQLRHPVGREFSIDARPQRGDRTVIGGLVSAEGDRICPGNHGFLTWVRSQPTSAEAPDKAAATQTIRRGPGVLLQPVEMNVWPPSALFLLTEDTPMTEIKEHMEVIGADGVHIGTVDRVEGGRIKLTKKDSGEGSHKGHHHYVDRGLVAGVEGNKVRLSAIGAVAVTLEEEKG
jgi:hypothetical protein